MRFVRNRAAQNALSLRDGYLRLQRSRFARIAAIIIVSASLIFCCPHLSNAEPGTNLYPNNYGYFDFPTCVRYALSHSSLFLRNRIGIQLKSIDLKDAHSELLPKLDLTTRYYLSRTGDTGQNDINVEFSMSNWNPMLALFKIRSKSIIVDIARTMHFEKMADGVGEIANLFLHIHAVKRRIRAHKQLAALAENKVSYGDSGSERGSADPLDARMWRHDLRGKRLGIKRLQQELRAAVASLKGLIGYHPDYHLPLDTRDAANQILGGFNGRLVTFVQIQSNSLSLKVAAKKEQLQSNAVTGSYVALLPQPRLLMEGLTNQVDRTSGVNVALGLDYTLWDGFRRVRNIKRQKLESRMAAIDRKELSVEIYNRYREIQAELDLLGDRQAFCREQTRLAELNEERALTQYKAGQLPYEQYIDVRARKVQASTESISALEKKVRALIELGTLAGGLNRYNARIRY